MSFGHKPVPCLWSVFSRRSFCSARSVLLFSFVILLIERVMLLFVMSICEWLFFLKFSEVTRFFNILAEEVLKMRRRGCCGLFLLKLVLFLHSLRFSGEMKFLKKNSKFEKFFFE